MRHFIILSTILTFLFISTPVIAGDEYEKTKRAITEMLEEVKRNQPKWKWRIKVFKKGTNKRVGKYRSMTKPRWSLFKNKLYFTDDKVKKRVLEGMKDFAFLIEEL